MIEGEEVPYLQKFYQNFHLEYKSYINLHISSVTYCDFLSFIRSISTYWPQEKALGCNVFAEDNYIFKQHMYIAAYVAIILQASWHISKCNQEQTDAHTVLNCC